LSTTPYISFVVVARNDGHGGNFLTRMQTFTDTLVDQCGRHGLRGELIIVEWNPPRGQQSLREALRWPEAPSHCAIRIVRVPKTLHDRYGNSDRIPLHQFIAKNVGIRRARGDVVVATNADVIFSDGLMTKLAEGNHDHERFYRVCRLDVSADFPDGAATPEKLRFCGNNVIRSHQPNGTRDLGTGTLHPAYRNVGLLRAVAWSFPVGFLPFLILCLLGRAPGEAGRALIEPHAGLGRRIQPAYVQACWYAYREVIDRAKSALALQNRFGRPYTNASGDFTMMAKNKWIEIGGYFEYPGFPRHIDGLLLYQALRHGLTETAFPEPACVYHIEHSDGSGFGAYVSGGIEAGLKQRGIPYITSGQLMAWLLSIAEGRGHGPENNAQWGLADETLEESTIAIACF